MLVSGHIRFERLGFEIEYLGSLRWIWRRVWRRRNRKEGAGRSRCQIVLNLCWAYCGELPERAAHRQSAYESEFQLDLWTRTGCARWDGLPSARNRRLFVLHLSHPIQYDPLTAGYLPNLANVCMRQLATPNSASIPPQVSHFANK